MNNVLYREEGSIAVIELSRPEKLNALTLQMLGALENHIAHIEVSRDIRAVVLTGQGKAFCVGADINVWSALEPLDMWRSWVRNGHRIFDALASLRQPVIAALNGHALGGGLELASAADIRLAVPEAGFGLPEASIATCPGWSGSQRLVRLIGSATVKYMALAAERLDADAMLRCGFIQKVVPARSLLDEAMSLASRITELAPISVQLTKQLVDAADGNGLAAAMEGMAGALAATTLDAKEGLNSFRERRKADYLGK